MKQFNWTPHKYDFIPEFEIQARDLHSSDEALQRRCRYLHNLDPKERCNFTRNSICDKSSIFILYHNFMFCTIPNPTFVDPLFISAIVLMILWLLFILLILSMVASHFFCPAVRTMAKILHLSENLAGVTLLSFINSMPNLLGSIGTAGSETGNTILMFNELLGSSMFSTGIVAGLVVFMYPFKLHPYHCLRDQGFLLFSIVWIRCTTMDEKVTLIEAISYIVIYVIYITLVIVGFIFQSRIHKWLKKYIHIDDVEKTNWHEPGARNSIPITEQSSTTIAFLAASLGVPPDVLSEAATSNTSNAVNLETSATTFRGSSATTSGRPSTTSRRPDTTSRRPTATSRRPSAVSTTAITSGRRRPTAVSTTEVSNVVSTTAVTFERPNSLSTIDFTSETPAAAAESTQKESLYREFWEHIKPVDRASWNKMSRCNKFITSLQIPSLLFLKLFIPIVNLSDKNHGWCKSLYTLHCLLFPTFIVLVWKKYDHTISNVTVFCITFPVGFIVAIIVYYTSVREKPPVYHSFFAFMGLMGTLWTICLLGGEVSAIMALFGTLLSSRMGTLALTSLAWANNIGSAISDISIAKQGFQKMAFAGCFGTPLNNNLLSMGITFIIRILKHSNLDTQIRTGVVGPTCTTFLMINLAYSIIFLLLTRYHARRSYGAFLLLVYLQFTVFCYVCEIGWSHHLGTDHECDNTQ